MWPRVRPRTVHQVRVTVWRPMVSTNPTNSTIARWKVGLVKAIENRDSSGSATLGNDNITDSFPHACPWQNQAWKGVLLIVNVVHETGSKNGQSRAKDRPKQFERATITLSAHLSQW